MEKIQASAYIIVKNEEHNIARCLESVKNFAEIVIVDSGSTDNTLEICQKYGVRIINRPWMGFAQQKQFALDCCSYDWVLNLDADEEISTKALDFIKNFLHTPTANGICFSMVNYFCGKKPHALSKNMKKLRFARKSSAQYDVSRGVHESLIVHGKITHTKTEIYHYGESNIHVLVEKINNYSTLKARTKCNFRPEFFVVPVALMAFILAFFRSYVIGRNFLNGNRGFVASFIIGFYAFLAKVKRISGGI